MGFVERRNHKCRSTLDARGRLQDNQVSACTPTDADRDQWAPPASGHGRHCGQPPALLSTRYDEDPAAASLRLRPVAKLSLTSSRSLNDRRAPNTNIIELADDPQASKS
jgi:hypothetical protein